MWAAIIVLGTAIANTLADISFLLQGSITWQRFLSLGLDLGASAACVASIAFNRRGQFQRAALTLIGMLVIVIPAFSSLLVGVGTILGLTVLFMVIAISAQVFTGRAFRWSVLVGLLSAAITSGLDTYFSSAQISAPQAKIPYSDLILPIIVGSVIATFIVYVVRQWWVLSIDAKLIIVFIALTLSVGSVIGIFLQNDTRTIIEQNIGDQISRLADSQAATIAETLARQLDTLKTLALNTTLQDAVEASYGSYIGDEAAIRAQIDQLDQQWRAASDDADPLVQYKLNNPIAENLRQYQQSFIDSRGNPLNVEVFLTDRYGALIAATARTSDYNQADELWWQTAYNNGLGGVSISSPEYDESTGQIAILMAVPLRDRETTAVIGVLRATYTLSALQEILATKIGQSGEIDLYFPGAEPKIIHGGSIETIDPGIQATIQNLSAEAYQVVDYAGTPSLVSRVPLRTNLGEGAIDDLGWEVIAHQPTAEGLASLTAQTQRASTLVLVTLGIASAAGTLAASILTRPISRLTQAAVQAQRGDLSVRVPVTSGDETGTLTSSFNEMARQLQQTLAGLETRIGERTRELTLAAEVGRTLSQVGSLDTLLNSAVELIRSRFDLYYTQIYLPDSAGRALLLQAGSGNVGAELKRRGHRLPIGPGSLNGRAAAEKHAVIVSDTAASPTFKPNPLLPETRSEMAVPLLVGDRVVGVLDMQSEQPGTFTEDNLPAFEALAGQLAIAVQNTSLFTQAQQARAEVEAQARRLTRAGWEDYLDAIDRHERMGATFADGAVEPLEAPIAYTGSDGALRVPLTSLEEPIGAIQLERGADQPWSGADAETVAAVGAQIARQIENLRLLAQAESYRLEAEEATRRLTREGWQNYTAETSQATLGYAYDQSQVIPLNEANQPKDSLTFVYDLKVRNEVIGELALGGAEKLSDEAIELLASVAERLSTHLENLRLTEQTQATLSETERLYQASAELNTATTYDQILSILRRHTLLAEGAHRIALNLFDHPWTEHSPAEWTTEIAAMTSLPSDNAAPQIGNRFRIADFAAAKDLLKPDRPTLIGDLLAPGATDETVIQLYVDVFAARSAVWVPLVVGGEWIGYLDAIFPEPKEFPEAAVRFMMTLCQQASTTVQSLDLLEKTQAHAQLERNLRQITSAVRSSTDLDTILRTTVRELGAVLGRKTLVRLNKPGE
jgi:GAF domain-containing protein/HAMP domain-containing protein